MCPDPQLLSVYFDGELPSPWKEKMDSHLANCPECRRTLETYGIFRSGKGSPESPLPAAETAACERVWSKISGSTDIDSGAEKAAGQSISPFHYQHKHRQESFWRRSVSIPLPAAAAAALFIIVFAALWTLRIQGRDTIPNMTVASEEYTLWPSGMDTGFDTSGMYPMADMQGVLQYLGNRDSGDIVIIRLPETRSFLSSGEPAIIRAADYSRRKH